MTEKSFLIGDFATCVIKRVDKPDHTGRGPVLGLKTGFRRRGRAGIDEVVEYGVDG